MTRKRGAPVLIELISRPGGPSVGASPVAAPIDSQSAGGGRGGSPVSNPANWGGAASRNGTTDIMGGGTKRSDMRLPALLIGAGIIVVVIAAIVGYQIGNKKERDNWAKNNAGGSGPAQSPAGGNTPTPPATGVIDPLNGGGNGGTLPLDPNAAAGGGVIKPPIPAPAPTTEAGLQDGWNYLVVATLRRTEAEEAARYLNDNQIPVQLVPYKTGGVDRGGGDANNGRWQLWILRGVPPGAFSKTQTERDALKSKIEMLGRTWKAKNRQAPTDFAEAYWQKK